MATDKTSTQKRAVEKRYHAIDQLMESDQEQTSDNSADSSDIKNEDSPKQEDEEVNNAAKEENEESDYEWLLRLQEEIS